MTKPHLVDNAIAGGEERQNVRNKVSLVVREAVPVLVVVREVELFGGPEARLGLLVHLPHLPHSRIQNIKLGGKESKTSRFRLSVK